MQVAQRKKYLQLSNQEQIMDDLRGNGWSLLDSYDKFLYLLFYRFSYLARYYRRPLSPFSFHLFLFFFSPI